MRRRLPRWREIAPLLGRDLFAPPSTRRRLARAASIADLREQARRRTPRAVFDYTDGAAGEEIALGRARAAYRRVEFSPRVLRDVSAVDPSTTLLGAPSAYPFAFAPTGFTRMMGHEGEIAVAEVAAGLGIPYALSTLGTTSLEALAAAVPESRRWFQLYISRDRSVAADLVDRAAATGIEAIIMTVDTPVGGTRYRDVRNGLTVPPALNARTLLDMSRYPSWWANLLTTEPLQFASLTSSEGTVAELLTRVFDPSLVPADVEWLRGIWPGPIIIKGVQSRADAVLLADLGVDAIVLSTHGGRQLDRTVAPLELLPAVRQDLGDRAGVWIDSGVMSGGDIVAALALGADAVLVGRAYLYGLMAGGQAGVARAAEILSSQVVETMALLGVRTVAELTAEHVRLRPEG